MFLFRLALLNLTRAPVRALLSSGAIVLGVFYAIAGHSLIDGTDEAAIYGVVNGVTGHVTVRPAGYPTDGVDHPVDEVLTVTPELRGWLQANTESWTERTLFAATVSAAGEHLRLRGIGFDPERDEAVFSRATWRFEQPVPGSAEDGVLIPNEVARLLDVSVGDRVVLQARSHAGALNALEAKVAAVGRTGNFMLDNGVLYVPEDLARELLRTPGPTHLSMRLPRRDDAAAKRAELEARGDWDVVDWWQEAEPLMEEGKIDRIALNVLVALLMLMSAMAIANVILMAAFERTREVGTLRSMGLSRRGVLALFLIEGGLLGVVAGGIGSLAGGALAWWMQSHPFDLGAYQEDMGTMDLQYSAFIYGSFSVPMVVVPLLLSVVVSLLASIYPARVAAQMQPADAVRAE